MLSLFIHLLVILLALALAGIIADIAEQRMYIKAQRKIKRRKNTVVVMKCVLSMNDRIFKMKAFFTNILRDLHIRRIKTGSAWSIQWLCFTSLVCKKSKNSANF